MRGLGDEDVQTVGYARDSTSIVPGETQPKGVRRPYTGGYSGIGTYTESM